MNVLSETIDQIRNFVQSRERRSWKIRSDQPWPAGGSRDIVIGDDVGLELGNPQKASVASSIWTDDSDRIDDDSITLIGPDIGESQENSLPFGKIVLVEVEGFSEENTYHRYLEIEGVRHDLDLKGYMIRAVSRTQKEWCRISKEALERGFSFDILGAASIEKLKERPYIRKAELIYVTSCTDDVKSIQAIVNPATRVIGAMNKMVNEMDLDCTTCEYSDVCNEIHMLMDMRKKLKAAKTGRNA